MAAAATETSRNRISRAACPAADHASLDPQRDLGLRVSARPLRLSRDLRDIALDRYRLPKDGRKWKVIARERMALAEWLATHGDADGSRIHPAVASMIRHFGWSHGKTCYLLKDLESLGLLISEKHLTSKHGTRRRRMDLRSFLGESWIPKRTQGIQHTVKESNVTLDTTVTQTVTQTGRIQTGVGEQSSVSSLSAKSDKPINARSPRTIAEKRQSAKRILVEDGHDPDLVEIALLRIDVLRAAVQTIPRVVSYFVVSVENSLASPDESAMCRSIVAERQRVGIAIDAPLRPEECSDAAKIKFLHAAVEDAESLGSRPAEIMEERMAAAGVAMK